MVAQTPAPCSHLEIAVIGLGGYAPARSVGITLLKPFVGHTQPVGQPSDLRQPSEHEWVKSLAHDFTHHSFTHYSRFLAELIHADWQRFPLFIY